MVEVLAFTSSTTMHFAIPFFVIHRSKMEIDRCHPLGWPVSQNVCRSLVKLLLNLGFEVLRQWVIKGKSWKEEMKRTMHNIAGDQI